MSYDGRVVLGESVDKLLIQSQINSFGDLVHDHWIKYSEHFKKSEERLTKSLNDWLFNFFGEWELRDLNWLYEINDIENGAELCGNRCHGERFSFTFRNTDVYSEIILSFTDLSSEMGLEPFSQLEFESIQIEVKIYRLHSDTLFADIMDLSKTNDFVEFLKLNFESFKKSLVDEYTELDQKCIQYSDDVERMLERYNRSRDRLGEIERFERIEEFFQACNEVLYFDEPRRIRIKVNTTVIGKSIRVLHIHGNQKYVDVVVDELDLGLNNKISYKSNTYNRVVIKTLFGFDLTTKESLKLLSNDL